MTSRRGVALPPSFGWGSINGVSTVRDLARFRPAAGDRPGQREVGSEGVDPALGAALDATVRAALDPPR